MRPTRPVARTRALKRALAWMSILAPALALPRAGTAQQGDTFSVRGERVTVERGEFRVPARRAAPEAGTLRLRFVRFPSTATRPGSPIVFLAGGPGDAATRAFSGMPPEFLDSLRAIADVIAFDQRGTGSSEPMGALCPPGSPWPLERAWDQAEANDSLSARLSRCLGRAAAQGLDVRAFTTWESADDLMALATALDAPRISLLAGSYGTHLALATAARRPTLVEELRGLRRRLQAAPAQARRPDGAVIVVGAQDLEVWMTEALDAIPEIADRLEALPQLLAGDFAPLARWAAGARRSRPINLMNVAMDCASYASEGRLARIRAQSEAGAFGGAINGHLPSLCEVPGLPRLPDAFRAPIRVATPALLISGALDGRTPPANAVEVAAGMPNAETLVLPDAAHSLMGHPTAVAAMLRFFRR